MTFWVPGEKHLEAQDFLFFSLRGFCALQLRLDLLFLSCEFVAYNKAYIIDLSWRSLGLFNPCHSTHFQLHVMLGMQPRASCILASILTSRAGPTAPYFAILKDKWFDPLKEEIFYIEEYLCVINQSNIITECGGFFLVLLWMSYMSPRFPTFFYHYLSAFGIEEVDLWWRGQSQICGAHGHCMYLFECFITFPQLVPFSLMNHFFFVHLFVWLHLVSILAILIEQWQEPQVFWWPPVWSLEDLCLDICVQNLCTWRSAYSPKI